MSPRSLGAHHKSLLFIKPVDPAYSTRCTIEGIEQMAISEAEKKMIFEDNARKLMRLPV